MTDKTNPENQTSPVDRQKLSSVGGVWLINAIAHFDRVRPGNLAVEAIWRVGDTRTNSIIATTIPVLPNSV